MSFLGGAECSTGANPLSQFQKHVQDDKTLQRDRLVGRGPGGMQESMRSQAMPGGQDKMMDEFLQHNQLPQGPGPASPFAMEQMRRELEGMGRQSNGSPGWAAEFEPGMQDPGRIEAEYLQQRPSGFNPAEFAKFQNARNVTPDFSTHNTVSGYQRPMMAYNPTLGVMGMQRPYSATSFQQPMQNMQQAKGKSRMVELDDKDWEAQFAELEQTGDAHTADQALDDEANAAMEAELGQLDRSVHPEEQDPDYTETDHFGDFENIWRGIQAESESLRQLADEEAAFQEHMGDLDQWEGFEGGFGGTNAFNRDPQLGDYLFEQENPFSDLPASTNPFEEGVRIMSEGGNLSLAALAFEAAVQRDPNHVDAWVRLGAAQAQNEKESPAIRALEQALKVDSNNLDALMGLAVSYTNEGYDSTAYRTLERWLSTKYPSLLNKEDLSSAADIGFTDRHALHERVTNLFIKAAQLSPSGTSMDPDVQVGLGVLFYGAEEYDKAVDCFGAALDSSETGSTNKQEEVHLLWNRLGATLANSGRSEEAIDAYSRALSLRPNFVRARYNLGVSCINIGCYAEAAQHLLGALSMHNVLQESGKEKAKELMGMAGGDSGPGVSDTELERMVMQNQSTNLYDTLRRVFNQMARRDLSERVGAGMDVESFRGEFEF